jgi:hypothetical protein
LPNVSLEATSTDMMKNVWCWTSSVLLWVLVIMTHHEDGMSMVAAEAGKLNRSLILENQSGNDMEIFWINHSTDEAHLIVSVLSAKKKAPIETFVGHIFEIRAIPDAETGTCTSQDNTCAVRRFTVGEDSHPGTSVSLQPAHAHYIIENHSISDPFFAFCCELFLYLTFCCCNADCVLI